MRALTSGTNIDAASSDYPEGRVRDANGGPGTISNEILFGDIIQLFFNKLINDAGITPNGLPDNETNGYELLTALVSKIRETGASTSQKGTVQRSQTSDVLTGTNTEKYISPYFNSYTNRFLTKTMSNGESYNVDIGVGRIFIPHNFDNCTINLPNVGTFAGQIIYVNVNGTSSGSECLGTGLSGSVASLDSNSLYAAISNGTTWYLSKLGTLVNGDGLACPFVYVNNVYFDEILKNIVDVDGEETIDLSSKLEIGNNELTISEEKEETTYMKKLYFNDMLLISDLVLKKGDKKTFSINYDGGTANLKAVGHYKYN